MDPNVLTLITLWVVAPYCKKYASISMSSAQILAYQSMFVLVLNVIRAYSSDSLTKVSFNRWFFACTCISFSSSVVYLHLCKTMRPSDFIPIVQPSVITITTLYDAYTSGNVRMGELFAVGLIVCGLVVLNMSRQ